MNLIPDFTGLDESSLHDVWLMLAKNAEEALQDCGARPGRDYRLLDLFTLAQPLVAQRWAEGLSYSKAWRGMDGRSGD